MMLVACGDKTNKTGVDADSLTTDSAVIEPVIATINLDSIRHSQEYITQRIDTIYKYRNDAKCCSNRYNDLTNKACKIAEELDDMFIDCDHWVAGQDIDPKFSYKIRNIKVESDSIAWVEMNIHNFSDHKVKLKLLYERDDWFVDDFLTTYMENGVAQEISEQENARDYISENKK